MFFRKTVVRTNNYRHGQHINLLTYLTFLRIYDMLFESIVY